MPGCGRYSFTLFSVQYSIIRKQNITFTSNNAPRLCKHCYAFLHEHLFLAHKRSMLSCDGFFLRNGESHKRCIKALLNLFDKRSIITMCNEFKIYSHSVL